MNGRCCSINRQTRLIVLHVSGTAYLTKTPQTEAIHVVGTAGLNILCFARLYYCCDAVVSLICHGLRIHKHPICMWDY